MEYKRLKVVVLGHSFVAGLDAHYRSQTPLPIEGMIPYDLKVDHLVSNISLLGKSGAVAFNTKGSDELLVMYKPALVLLQFGSNDLVRKVPVGLSTFTS